jgi:hypothetical protein
MKRHGEKMEKTSVVKKILRWLQKKFHYIIIARKITKYGLFNYSRTYGKTTSSLRKKSMIFKNT